MASTHKSLRSSTANKRPTTAISDGQIALNTNSASPGLFFKDSTGATIIKIGPVHVGTTAPNATPGAGGSSGNSTGEIWLDTSLTPVGVKIWNGSAFVNATPIGSTTVQGLLELATNTETQTGTDVDRAVTPAGLQSKLSDSISTTSSSTIASSTAVKTAYDLAALALPKAGGTVTGNLEIGTTGTLSFEGATADAFETTIAVVDPTADRTITLPNVTGTVVTTGDTGTVTSTMLLDGTILNADINASAAIVDTKLATISTALKVSNSATTATNANTASAIVARDASGNFSAGTITAALTGNASTVTTNANLTGDVTSVGNATSIASGVIVNADVNASAAIAGTKISPDFGSQNVTTTGTGTAASFIPSSSTAPANGMYLSAANTLAFNTNTAASPRLVISSGGLVGIGTGSPDASLNVRNGFNNTAVEEIASFSRPDAAVRAVISKGVDSGTANGISFGTSTGHPLVFNTGGNQRFYIENGSGQAARIDSGGRLLVGTSSVVPVRGYTPGVQLSSITTASGASLSVARYNNDTNGGEIVFSKSRSGSNGNPGTKVQEDDTLGSINWIGDNGTDLAQTSAQISAAVDGTTGVGDMPGRLVFSTTADGASSPTEQLRITNDGVRAYNQPAPTSKSAAATLTIAELKTGIIQYTGAAATLTLPTGTLAEGGFSGIYTNMTFEWSVINTGSGLCTIGAGTAHTIVGGATIAAGASGKWASRRSAANTFISYRLS